MELVDHSITAFNEFRQLKVPRNQQICIKDSIEASYESLFTHYKKFRDLKIGQATKMANYGNLTKINLGLFLTFYDFFAANVSRFG